MRLSIRFVVVLSLLMALTLPASVEAARRGVRVDAGGWSVENDFGTIDCPGSHPLSGNVAASLPLDWNGYRFHGIGDTAYTHRMYCQVTVTDQFNADSMEFLFPPEPGLRALVGPNVDNAITGIRYTWMTGDFLFDGPGFQWAFFSFPRGITIVSLYGLIDPNTEVPVTLDSSTAIKEGSTTHWSAAGNQFDGEYFCFVDGTYVGLWNGELNDSDSACLRAAVFYADGFE